MVTRRAFLAGGSLAVGAAMSKAADAEQADGPSLAALAAGSGRFFGAALSSTTLRNGGHYRDILQAECSVWVPEWELKWGALSPDLADRPDFSRFDFFVEAAAKAGKRLRGHALIWHEHTPAGLSDLQDRTDWDRFVTPHIRTLAGRHDKAVFQWDVVNEAIEPRDGGGDGMRRTPFYQMLGPDYVAEAFRVAHQANPSASLYLNEYDLCYAEPWQERRRTALLKLLETLLHQGVPIHGLGIQGHFDTRHRFDEPVFADFIRAVEALGLEIAVTELDVREADNAGGMTLKQRRGRAADEVRRVLSVALDSPALTGVVTWGLADHQSWLRKTRPIPDNQGLPYDDRMQPTAMRTALADLFKGANLFKGAMKRDG